MHGRHPGGVMRPPGGPAHARGPAGRSPMEGTTTNWAWRIARGVVFLVYAAFLVYVVILSTAFVLRLFGANPAADFANWVYTAADRVMEPFRGIFPTHEITERALFDASLLFAIIVY